jgi:hypothetical protein
MMLARGLYQLCVFFFALTTASICFAQTDTARLQGTVTDPSDAIVVKATVTVKNSGTGLAATAETNREGYYVIPGLSPGRYNMEVSQPGFQKFERDFELQVSQVAVVDVKLQVGTSDSTIRVQTPNGPSFRRYNHDGYGETFFGDPWLGQGIGRLWPVFTGERGEYEVASGRDASLYADAMLHFANAGGMIPEQIWDQAEPTASRFVFGQGTGSATPLAWSMAQFVRLVVCMEEKRIVEQPDVVAQHFLKNRR